jgi:hypothetical protein
LVLLPAVLAGQEAGVVVKGLVVDAQTGKALAGAGVSLRATNEDEQFTQSDAQGRFQVELAGPGRYFTRAIVSPYEPGGEIVEVGVGQKEVEVTVSLDRGSVLAGRVTDHLDRPVVGARVSAYSREIVQQGPGSIETAWTRYDSHSSFSTSAYKGVTDDRGEYRIWGLRPGEYVLFAKPSPDPAAPGVVRLRAAPMFYPSVEKFEEAGSIRLGWAEVREGLDIRVGPPAATRQTVRIVGASPGCRSCGVNVYRRGAEFDLLVAFAGASPNGELVLEGFAPGEYQIGARQSEGIGPGISGQLDFLITADGDRPVQVALGPMVVVKGRVILEDAPNPLPEPPFKNPMFPQFNVVRIYNLPGEREKISYSCRGEATLFVGEGAERTFEALAFPGRCRLDVRGPMSAYIASITLDGQPLEKSEIVIPPEGLTSEVVVRVRFDMGEVAGRLEEPGETDWIFFLPAGEDKSGGYLPGKVEADGTFRAKLPPGAWEALALRGSSRPVLSGNHIQDLANLSRRLPRVQVKAGQTIAITEPLSVIE